MRWRRRERCRSMRRRRSGCATARPARMVPLTPAVASVLEDILRVPDNPWVIAEQKPGARMTNVNVRWLVARARAGFEDVRMHDLRHSWIAVPDERGTNMPQVWSSSRRMKLNKRNSGKKTRQDTKWTVPTELEPKN